MIPAKNQAFRRSCRRPQVPPLPESNSPDDRKYATFNCSSSLRTDDRAVHRRQPLGDDLDSQELAARSSLRTWSTSSMRGGGASSEMVQTSWWSSTAVASASCGRPAAQVERSEFAFFGHDALSGRGARHIRANLLNSESLSEPRRLTGWTTSL
jgi:hypothetical protein